MSATENPNYKSPLKKLVNFFEQSRNQWKEKYLRQKAQVKQLKNRVRYLEKTKTDWKEKAIEFKKELNQLQSEQWGKPIKKKPRKKKREIRLITNDFEMIPFHHQYSIGMVRLFLSFVLTASSSLRGAFRSLEVAVDFFGWSLQVPSWHCTRLWLLRLGYYKLNCEKELATDWAWIVDLSHQLGTEKAFVILGIRLCHLPKAKSLKHEEVEAITRSPVTKSNGETVYQQLEESVKKTGVPRVIVGDYGSDLKAGIKRFCQRHPETD